MTCAAMLIFASANGTNSPSRYATPCSEISACGDGPAAVPAAARVVAIVIPPANWKGLPDFWEAFAFVRFRMVSLARGASARPRPVRDEETKEEDGRDSRHASADATTGKHPCQLGCEHARPGVPHGADAVDLGAPRAVRPVRERGRRHLDHGAVRRRPRRSRTSAAH